MPGWPGSASDAAASGNGSRVEEGIHVVPLGLLGARDLARLRASADLVWRDPTPKVGDGTPAAEPTIGRAAREQPAPAAGRRDDEADPDGGDEPLRRFNGWGGFNARGDEYGRGLADGAPEDESSEHREYDEGDAEEQEQRRGEVEHGDGAEQDEQADGVAARPAAGVDGQTAKQYEEDLRGNLKSLRDRFKSGLYKAPPPIQWCGSKGRT